MNNHALGAITDTRESVLEATQLLDTASIWLEDVPEASAEWRKIKTALLLLEEAEDSLYRKEHGFEPKETPSGSLTSVCKHCDVTFKHPTGIPIPSDCCSRCAEEIEVLSPKYWAECLKEANLGP